MIYILHYILHYVRAFVSMKCCFHWLCALPSPPLGLVLDNSSLRIAVGLHLGTQLCHPHKCRYGEDVDRYGTHGLCCSKKGGKRIGTFSRHSVIHEILRQAFNKINVPTQLEPPGMFRFSTGSTFSNSNPAYVI
jgi:hypothetical protein